MIRRSCLTLSGSGSALSRDSFSRLLTMLAYASVGIGLGHFTGSQWNSGTHISSSQLAPGDLVFFYPDHHHVGIYIGGGQFIHAPHTGDVVKISSLADRAGNFSGAVRPY